MGPISIAGNQLLPNTTLFYTTHNILLIKKPKFVFGIESTLRPKLGVSITGYPPIFHGTGTGTGTDGSWNEGTGTGTAYTGSSYLGTGPGTAGNRFRYRVPGLNIFLIFLKVSIFFREDTVTGRKARIENGQPRITPVAATATAMACIPKRNPAAIL